MAPMAAASAFVAGISAVSRALGASEQCLLQSGQRMTQEMWSTVRAPSPRAAAVATGPNWGCGLVGTLPSISRDGVASGETRRLIDGIKGSSDFGKATYWNWNVAPQQTGGHAECLSSDMIFMPEVWGAGAAVENGPGGLRQAGKANFPDMMGGTSPAEMATILLGMNEPDIVGSCMGNMFGKCTKPCAQSSVDAGKCPIAYPSGPPADANEYGECNCWQFSYPTGVGYWNLAGCAAPQPLPTLFENPQLSAQCVNVVMDAWKETARVAKLKGYKYLSTPLVAVDIGYARRFLEHACGCNVETKECACTDASCGCPVYIGFHFYGNDCQPETLGTYDGFRQRLRAAAAIMEDYPFVQGAIINEVGMLNFAFSAIGEPGTGKFPAEQQPGHSCPRTAELPKGMATFLEKMMDLVIEAKTRDGRDVVKGFSWFNQDSVGGTYDLRLQGDDGRVNELGEAYIAGCSKWAQSRKR